MPKFELVINVKTAKALGLTIPQSVLLRADDGDPVMDRRKFVGAMVGALIAAARAASAQPQPAKVYRIGFLGTQSAAEFASQVDALRAGLRELGYVEDKNILIEFRWADGNVDRLPKLATELVQLNVDVLVTHAEGTSAAKRATASIPIVMAYSADAMAMGLVASLARPEGNVTGSTIFIPEISAKRLELLKAAVPHITRVAVLVRKDSSWKNLLQMLQSTGKAMNLTMQFFEVRGPAEFESAFSEMAKARMDALAVSEDPMLAGYTNAVARLAEKYRWPSTGVRGFAQAGGLIGYGVDALAVYRHAAAFVDKILKGAKPRDLPVEQPTKFELVINLKTAKALGVTIPKDMLLRANEVIQ